MDQLIGLVSVVMVFSIPLTAIFLGHVRGNQKIKAKMLKDEFELERLKGENFLVETEKMRLELQQMQLSHAISKDPVIIELQKEQLKSVL